MTWKDDIARDLYREMMANIRSTAIGSAQQVCADMAAYVCWKCPCYSHSQDTCTIGVADFGHSNKCYHAELYDAALDTISQVIAQTIDELTDQML